MDELSLTFPFLEGSTCGVKDSWAIGALDLPLLDFDLYHGARQTNRAPAPAFVFPDMSHVQFRRPSFLQVRTASCSSRI